MSEKPARHGENDKFTEEQQVLEALLFAGAEPLSIARLKTILPGTPDARHVKKMIEIVNQRLGRQRHPFEIMEVAGGYQVRTVSYFAPWVRQLFRDKPLKKLSIQALECLAIIAYRQPISKAEIEAVRGVLSDGAMKTLLERRLVTICGRSDKPGRPLLYGTSPEFLAYFGLKAIEDLPGIQEFEALAREKMAEEVPLDQQSSGPGEEERAADAAQETDRPADEGPLPDEQAVSPEPETARDDQPPPSSSS